MIIAGARMTSGWLLAAGLCVGPVSPAITQMPRVDAVRPRPIPDFPSEAVHSVGLDVLDDGVEMPDALNQRAILMDEAQTELRFRVYAVGKDSRFYRELSDYPHLISARVVGTGGRDPLRVRVRHTEEGGKPHWVLRILRRPRRGRTISMQVTFRYTAPALRWHTKLIVTILGRLPAPE